MRVSLLIAGVLWCAANPAAAQDTKAPKPVKRSNKPKFAIPETTDPGQDPDGAAKRRVTPMEETLSRLAGWPREGAKRAAEQLIVQREKSKDLVLQVLLSSEEADVALKPGCAYVLGNIGTKNDALALILAASEPEQVRHAKTYFEAAHKLDPTRAISEAFRFFYDSRTTLRRQAEYFVKANITAANQAEILRLLNSKSAPRGFTRVIGLSLLDKLLVDDQLKWAEISKHLYTALGDYSPRVARQAMKFVASRNDKDNIAVLNSIIQGDDGRWRDRAYAALALSIMSRAFQVQPFEDKSVEMLQGWRGLKHSRMLPQAAAAISLAQVALRTGDAELARLLDRTVPVVLIQSVGADGRSYKDFSSVQPLAYAMLRRITGQNLPDKAPVWARWWSDYGRRFRARRELVEVAVSDLPETSIDLALTSGSRTRFLRLTVAGPHRPTFLRGRAYSVPREEMQAVIEFLRGEGLFKRPETDPTKVGPGDALVVVRVGNLDRTVAYPEGSEGRQRERIAARVEEASRKYAWQRWWDLTVQPSWPLFFAENVIWFRDHLDAAAREERLRGMVAGSLMDLVTMEDRIDAVSIVQAMKGGGANLDAKEVDAFVRAVKRERDANVFVQRTVDLLVPDAGTRASTELIDALAVKARGGDLLLVKLCGHLELGQLIKLATDERWNVRRSSVQALADRDSPAARMVLVKRLADSAALVRVAATESLARNRDAALVPHLKALAGDKSGHVRAAAAYAYGMMPGVRTEGELKTLLYEDGDSLVRRRAIEGLATGARPDAADLLMGVFATERETYVRADAALALVKLENPKLVARLILMLRKTSMNDPKRVPLVNVLARMKSPAVVPPLQSVLLGDDVASADAAALGLARRWDETSLSNLVQMLKRQRNAHTAVLHLQILTSTAFETEDYADQASNYENWTSIHVIGNPRIWFRDALRDRVYNTAPLTAWAAAKSWDPVPESAVPVLLDVLGDKDWYLVRNASMLLAQYAGPDNPGSITHVTRADERTRIVAAWHDWWGDLIEKQAAEERN